jgi:hypothetical protein
VKDLPEEAFSFIVYPRAVFAGNGREEGNGSNPATGECTGPSCPASTRFLTVHRKARLSEMRNIEDHCSKSKQVLSGGWARSRTLECVVSEPATRIFFYPLHRVVTRREDL